MVHRIAVVRKNLFMIKKRGLKKLASGESRGALLRNCCKRVNFNGNGLDFPVRLEASLLERNRPCLSGLDVKNHAQRVGSSQGSGAEDILLATEGLDELRLWIQEVIGPEPD